MSQQKGINPFNEAHTQFQKGDIEGAMQKIQDVALLYISEYFSVGWKKVQEDDMSTMEEVKKMPPRSTADLHFQLFDCDRKRNGAISLKIRGTENNPIFIISVGINQPDSGPDFKVFEKTYVFTALFDAEQH